MRLVKKTTEKKVASPRKQTNGESEDENEYETYDGEIESDNQKVDLTKEIDALRMRLLQLEKDNSDGQLKERQTRLENNPTTAAICTPVKKCTNPTEGKMLGRYDGRGDLETFLTKFQRCSSYFGWSEKDQVFQLTNA